MFVPPWEYAPALFHSPLAAPLPSMASATGWIRNSQSSVADVGIPLEEITSPTISLNLRDILIVLTTFFFNPWA